MTDHGDKAPGGDDRHDPGAAGSTLSNLDLASFGLVVETLDPAFEELVRIAVQVTGCKHAFITFAQNDKLRVVAAYASDAQEFDIDGTMCGTTFHQRSPLIVKNLSADERFETLPFVLADGGFRFYAGFPLQLDTGATVGTFCVVDTAPRPQGLSETEHATLSNLRRLAIRTLEGRRRDARLKDYLDVVSDWTWEQDAQFRFTYVSEAARENGVVIEDFLGKTRWDVRSPNGEDAAMWAEHRAILERYETFRDFRVQWSKDGHEHVYSISGRPVFDQKGEFIGYRGAARDVSEQENAQREVAFLAHHDPLTKLPNRTSFELKVADAFRDWQETGAGASLFLIDLDQFKMVNDTLGHSTGDALLKEVAERIRSCVSADASLARLGGDEFAILEPDLTRDGAVGEYAAMLCQAIGKPYEIDHEVIDSGCSIGIAALPDDGGGFSQIMGNADLALYDAKANGRGRFALFDIEMRRAADRRNTLSRELCEAFDANQFDLVFQPIVRMTDGRVIGAEALLRWDHPERGRLSPGAFIAALDSTRYAADVGYWSLERACRTAVGWSRRNADGFRLSVNLFAGQLRDPRLVNRVRTILESTGFDGRFLELEITENILLTPTPDLLQTLQELKRLGINIVLDDFGTGYGSLTHLLQFPIDRIKVDRQFVRGLDVHLDYNTVTHALVKLAVDLQLKVTAEGIETEEQKQFLVSIGCTDMQGYHFSRPVSATEIDGLLNQVDDAPSAKLRSGTA